MDTDSILLQNQKEKLKNCERSKKATGSEN